MKKILSDEEIRQRAQNIVKYQNFNTAVALEKMDIKMPKIVFESGINYLKRGLVTKPISKKLKDELDHCTHICLQPLRPRPGEERKFRKAIYQNKEAKSPICRIKQVQKICNPCDYGVQINGSIKLFKSEIEAKGFMQGVKYIDNNIEMQLFEVKLNKVE